MATQEVINTNIRYIVTFVSGLLTMPLAAMVLSPEQITDSVKALQEVGDGLQQAFGGIYKLIAILGPVVGVWMGWLGTKSSTFKALVDRIKRTPDAVTEAMADPKAAVPLATAVAEAPTVKGVVTDASVAAASPSPLVQPTASALPQSAQ